MKRFAGPLLWVFLSFVVVMPSFGGERPLPYGPPPADDAAADSTVAPALGGPGFEGIAGADGWRTGSYTPEQLRYVCDTNAQKGGSISVGLLSFPPTLCAYGRDENTAITRTIIGFVYEPLISVHSLTQEFLPVLASHWKVGADGQTYFFRIDPNARFSDGHRVTTEDVVATYKLAMDSTILSPFTNSFYAEFDAPVVISPYIFSVRSKTKNWKNMLYFGGTTILPAHVIGGLSGREYIERHRYAMVPGTGPYLIPADGIRPDSMITLVRHPGWWGATKPDNRGQYNFDSIVLAFDLNQGALADRFVQGKSDLFPVHFPPFWSAMRELPYVRSGVMKLRQVYTDSPQGICGLAFNMRRPPLDDPRVREAIIRLFDPEREVVQDSAREYWPLFSYLPNSIYENPANRRFPYDRGVIASLMADAGYTRRGGGFLSKKGKPLVVELMVNEYMSNWMGEFQERARSSGIDLRFVTVAGDRVPAEVARHAFTATWMGWGGLTPPNPISSFHSSLADQTGSNNIAGFRSPEADSLMELEQCTFDLAERVRILRRLDSILVEGRMYALAWYKPYTRIAYWDRFGHPDYYLGRFSEWEAALITWWVDPKKARMVDRAWRGELVTMPAGEMEVRFWPAYNAAHPFGGGSELW